MLHPVPEHTLTARPHVWLAALAEPNRLAILQALCAGPESVAGLATALGVVSENLGHHLRMLRRAGLVSDERRGSSVWYHLAGGTVRNGRLELTHVSGVEVIIPLG